MNRDPVDYYNEISKIRGQSVEKYAYYLLAGNASAIAFAITQTHDTPLSTVAIPLILAVICWAYGFYAGCRFLDYSLAVMDSNIDRIQIQIGMNPICGSDPMIIASGVDITRKIEDEHAENANRYGTRQFPAIVIGAIFFIAWHLLRMALLNPQIASWINRVLPIFAN